MQKFLLKNLKYYIAISLALFLLGGQPVEFGKDKTFFHGFLIQKPIIRIGLGANLDQIKISSSSGMKIYEVQSNYKLIADDVDEVFIKGNKEKLTEKFIIQVAQAKDREEAETAALDLRKNIERKVYVSQNHEEEGIAGSFRILIGDFLTRGDALNYIVKLNQLGFKDTWIIREEIADNEPGPLWILVNEESRSLDENSVLYFIPSNAQSFLSYHGRDYRGILTLKAGSRGLVLVNTINLDDYLKAVVPSELSPYNFSEIEAQKAQAVAARTYAIKNMGLYEDRGYDLDDTPKTQFYRGLNAEHPLSSQAVEETMGEIALYRGKLINALYTSTCGGRTEDVENVFLGPSLPYLRSTECVYEKQREWQVSSSKDLLPVYINGENISPEIAAMISLGIISNETNPAYYQKPIPFQVARQWISKASSLSGKNFTVTSEDKINFTLDDFTQLTTTYFGWQDRIDNLLLESESDFILKNIENWPEKSRARIAYFIQTGIFPSPDEAANPQRVFTRGEMVRYLWKIMREHKDFAKDGLFQSMNQESLIVEAEGKKVKLELATDVFLLRNYGGIYSFVSDLVFLGGEKIKWIATNGKAQLLEVIYPPYSNILDRSSTYHNWQTRISREDLSRRINKYYPVGDLKDLEVQKRGSSRRVFELLIKGEHTQTAVKGLRIRRVLGLRETLFIIDREYDENNQVAYFTFRGKGWGHGVGLCQVGAFGMARAGGEYSEILKKYYQGITIDKIY